jgi:hypothetical protein
MVLPRIQASYVILNRVENEAAYQFMHASVGTSHMTQRSFVTCELPRIESYDAALALERYAILRPLPFLDYEMRVGIVLFLGIVYARLR